ncbi:MAG TPA: prolyl oligopeptidase family serine peptidase [Candidatus Bathyarchaeia archaeon]|nr:prolyl oligopeptidase family serine peptidase [Candidatus Bathyarchaeia archaeon]
MFQILLALLLAVPAPDAPVYPDKLNVMCYQDAGGVMHDIQTPEDLQIRRAHTRANMLKVMGPLPDRTNLPPLDVEVVETVDEGSYVRKTILFTPEPGDRLPAYLCIPKNISGKVPGILCLHQTIAIGKAETVGIGVTTNRNYAQELAQRGYVTLAPDYIGFGDYKIDVYARGYASATAKGIGNHMRCVDLLESLPEVDPDRIGAIGHSLGGHNTLFVGAFDERIKVMVTSCGFTRFHKYYEGDLTGWSHKGYMPRIAEVYHKNPDEMPFDFTEILATIAPRTVFINAPLHDANFEVSGVRDCVGAALPAYRLYDEAENLLAVYPASDHDFPAEARELAYHYIDLNFRFPPGRWEEPRVLAHDLRVGSAFHAFDHLSGTDHQGEVAAACGATIIYGSGLGGLGYSGLPATDELARTLAAESEYNRKLKSTGIKTCLGYLCATSIVGLDTFDKNWRPEFRAKFSSPPAEWLQQGRDGQALKSWYGGDYNPACMNNPDWRKYQREMIKLQVESGHDGVFFDNPTVHTDGCYCAYCMKKFAAFCAQESLPVADTSVEAMRKFAADQKTAFMRFRSTIAADFFSEMRAYVRILDRNALLTANNSLNHPSVFFSQSRGLGYNIYEMSKAEDFVVVEDMSTQPRMTDKGAIEYGHMYRMTHAISHGKPLVAVTIAEADYHTPPNLVRLAMAEAAAHGASYMLWSTWPEGQRQRMIDAVRPQADWLRSQVSLFETTTPRRDVSVFLPFRRWTETDKCAVSDIAGELTRRNVQYAVFCEDDFSLPELQEAPVLVVEEPSVLNEQENNVLSQYVSGGGKVVFAANDGWTSSINPSLVIKNAPHVHGIVRDAQNATTVFLYNLNIRRISSFEDAVTPADHLQLEIKIPWKHVANVTLSTADEDKSETSIPFSLSGDTLSIEIPTLHISALLQIKIN